MILQLDTQEWKLLQDAVAGIVDNHTYEERCKMTKKLSQIFNEQCKHPDEAPFGLREKFEATLTTR